MDLVCALSLLVAVLGVVLYLVSANGKAQEVGRLAYAVGLLAFLLRFAAEASLRIH